MADNSIFLIHFLQRLREINTSAVPDFCLSSLYLIIIHPVYLKYTLFDIDIFVDGLMQFVKKENKLQIPNLNNIHCSKANV